MDVNHNSNQIDVIDFHVQIYPKVPWPNAIREVKTKITHWLRPLVQWQQEIPPLLHKLPKPLRSVADEISVPLTLPHLALQSDIFDLEQEMQRNQVSRAVLVPQPPFSSNDFIFYESKRLSGSIPATFIDPQHMKSANDLKAFYNRGVRVFVINPLLSGVPIDAPYYRPFLSFLNEKKALLIIHTGAIASHFFRLPQAGDISEYEGWIADYQDIQFLAAHMNFHHPEKAMAQAKKYKNLYLMTSWQSKETLQKAIEEVGAQKLIFSSHWPFVGENISAQKERILALHAEGVLHLDEVKAIFSGNAEKLLSFEA